MRVLDGEKQGERECVCAWRLGRWMLAVIWQDWGAERTLDKEALGS